MKNYKQAGINLEVLAPYPVQSGGGVQVGNLFGIASDAAAEGASVVIVTHGVFEMAKPLQDVFTVGAPVYWDDEDQTISATVTDSYIGVAYTAAPNPSGTVEVRLNGFLA